MQDMLLFPAKEAEQIIAAHDGDVALLWLCLRQNPEAGVEDAARMLCRTRSEMEAALEKLQRMGFADMPGSSAPDRPETPSLKLPPADELPQYTSQELVDRSREDPRFTALVTEAKRALGHALSTTDLKKLFGLYDYLALPPEVIMMLLNYCVKMYPVGSPPSMRQIEKEGYVWANREILTIEQADDYIRRQKERSSAVGRIQHLLGLSDHKLTAPERRNINAWLDMGFGDEAINLAYERTVYNLGSFKWPYMNKILQSWHSAGLHDRQAIEEKDGRRRPARPAVSAPSGESRNVDVNQLREILENI